MKKEMEEKAKEAEVQDCVKESTKIELHDSTMELKETKVYVKSNTQKPHFKLEVQDSKMGTSSKIGGK